MDGSADSIDAVLVMNAYVDSAMSMNNTDALAQMPLARADVNGDGAIDLIDAQLILQYYVSTTLADSGLSPQAAWEQLR